MKDAVTGALAELDAMRTKEAAHLVQDLLAIVKRMRKTLGAIRKRAPQVVAEYHIRLKDRLNQLLAQTEMAIDDATLAREVAILADRADITEEITRLGAHLQQFEEYLASDGDVGRTLDFLTQEMLREGNTIGSKSNDVEIARAVIALKSDVDRLKEQSANLE
ncbi:MAG: endoribonuclease YicC domain-containing protein [Planctomycetota bacterium]